MRFDVLTLFPKMFDGVLGESMIKRAVSKKIVSIAVHDLRVWAAGRHKTADDYPYGGGPGMVLMVEPIYQALESLKALPRKKRAAGKKARVSRRKRVILMTPQGRPFSQALARELSKEKELVFVCGHYEGVDERVRSFVTDEISIGDYILTCGEIPSMVVIDAVARLIPGVVGKPESIECESFEKRLLEYPQYTKPRSFKGLSVPEVLLSGDHGKIRSWRNEEAFKRTRERRPDLLVAGA